MEEYGDFITETGYGLADGLHGVNCRHSFAPFVPGVSTPRWTQEELKKYATKAYTFTGADGKEKAVDAYAASQTQRKFESDIRHVKRKISINQVANLSTIKEKKDLKAVQDRYKQFLEETGLRRQHSREKV